MSSDGKLRTLSQMKRGSTFIAETIGPDAKAVLRESIAAQKGESANVRESAILGSSKKRLNIVEEARRKAAAIAREQLKRKGENSVTRSDSGGFV